MIIHVGKSYEGTSGNAFKDGDYDLQIIKIKSTKGRVNITFATSGKRFLYKTFFLLDKQGQQNENAYRELSDFITTAMQIDDEDVELDIRNAVGSYVTVTLRNTTFEKADGTKQASYWLNRPKRCDGFSDGTGSVLEDIMSKNRRMSEEEEEEDSAPVEEDKTDVGGESDYDSFFN